jgi:hypothetical protein
MTTVARPSQSRTSGQVLAVIGTGRMPVLRLAPPVLQPRIPGCHTDMHRARKESFESTRKFIPSVVSQREAVVSYIGGVGLYDPHGCRRLSDSFGMDNLPQNARGRLDPLHDVWGVHHIAGDPLPLHFCEGSKRTMTLRRLLPVRASSGEWFSLILLAAVSDCRFIAMRGRQPQGLPLRGDGARRAPLRQNAGLPSTTP